MQMEQPQGPGWGLFMGPASWTRLPRPGDLLLPLIVHLAYNRGLAEALIWRPLTYRGPDILANLLHWVPSTFEELAVLYHIYNHSMYGFALPPNGPQLAPPARASRVPEHRHGVPLSQSGITLQDPFVVRAVQEWAHDCGWDPVVLSDAVEVADRVLE